MTSTPPHPPAPTATTTATEPTSSSDPVGTLTTTALTETLGQWFEENARPLPWRTPDCTPWGVLVSEVMSQQTPVARVAPIWLDWMGRWPTPADFAQAPTAEVLRAWGSLGYPRRALRLHECARTIVERHDGEVPESTSDLLALPGIGTYTAAAVQAFAFGRRSVVLDTNIRRVLTRVLGGEALPPPSLTSAEMSRAAAVVPADDASAARWAAASMELGAVVCTARAPRCDECPVSSLCAWRAAGYPADAHAARRRTQAWAGTDRQVRGTVMAALRAAHSPVPAAVIDQVWPDPTQLARCLTSLVADGLIARTGQHYHLPVELG